MASFYTTIAAVCLVAFTGLQTDAGNGVTYKWTAEEVTDDGYLSVNLARNGNLAVHINEVKREEKLVNSLKTTVAGNQESRADSSCETLMQGKVELKDVFHKVFDPQEKPDYRQLLQTSLEEGLAIFKSKEYPENPDGWTTIWENEAFANLAYLLNSNSTAVGCVIGKCTSTPASSTPSPPQVPGNGQREAEPQVEKAVLFCDLDPPATEGKAPFDKEYFTALTARTTKLANMTEDDLKAPTNDGTTAAAVPTIMFASLVAILTAVSV
ncbi:SAG family member [Eimeria brunetti]|uniref:SAG family member n=1 Tax=Eimeria brunetti TaxID=51314 RepID=U6LAM9_9EIME|nr:SAG family member [Eimeria brunetti]